MQGAFRGQVLDGAQVCTKTVKSLCLQAGLALSGLLHTGFDQLLALTQALFNSCCCARYLRLAI